MQEKLQKWGLNGFTLKWIALITMIIDHTGATLFPEHMIFRIIGRLAFPIYCFLLVEGAVYTKNKRGYLIRLLAFAVISEIPFDLMVSNQIWNWGAQNVFFTLSIGLLAVYALQKNKPLYSAAALVLIFVAEFLTTDYGAVGILFIIIFYAFREKLLVKGIAFGVADIFLYGGVQSYAVLALVPIYCYNGKRGRKMKYFFYAMYPIHLLILYGIRKIVWGV